MLLVEMYKSHHEWESISLKSDHDPHDRIVRKHHTAFLYQVYQRTSSILDMLEQDLQLKALIVHQLSSHPSHVALWQTSPHIDPTAFQEMYSTLSIIKRTPELKQMLSSFSLH